MTLIKVTLPKRQINFDGMITGKYLEPISREYYEFMIDGFRRSYQEWDHKPSEDIKKKKTLRTLKVKAIYTGDEYAWTNYGTEPRVITSDSGMFFREYSPKSRPGTLSSFSGGDFGPFVGPVFEVDHPGAEPRRFDKTNIRDTLTYIAIRKRLINRELVEFFWSG